MIKTILCLLLIIHFKESLFAQYENLDSKLWYPLKVGNVWNFQTDFINNSVTKIDRDSVINEQKWFRFKEIYHQGPDIRQTYWSTLTGDNYILTTSDFINIDTLYKTSPRSILTVKIPYDSTLQSKWAIPHSTNYDGFADVYLEGEDSLEIDSFIKMKAFLGFYGDVYLAEFIYRIGWNLGLSGAIVDGIEYGDVSTIKTVSSVRNQSKIKPDKIVINIYPNPFNPTTTISVFSVNASRLSYEIVDILGKKIESGNLSIGNGSQTFIWPHDNAKITSGLYFLIVKDLLGNQSLNKLTLVK